MYNEKCDCGFSERDKSLGQGDPRNLIHCLNKEARVCDRQALQTAHAPLKNSVNINDPKQLLLRAHHLWLYVANETVLDMNESVADVGERPWHPLIFWRKLRSEGRKKVFWRHRNPPPPSPGSSWPCPPPLSWRSGSATCNCVGVKCFILQLFWERLSENMCARQSRRVTWDMINILFLTL